LEKKERRELVSHLATAYSRTGDYQGRKARGGLRTFKRFRRADVSLCPRLQLRERRR
jgi:hypothetical protein